MGRRQKKEMVFPQTLVGKMEDEAIALIKAKGLKCRITRRDDKYFRCTRDYRRDRINLAINNGKVASAHIG